MPKDDKQRIVIVEPSPFRRAETYVLGPFGRFKAWWVANRECSKHPFSEVRVVPSRCRVEQGERVLWDGTEATA